MNAAFRERSPLKGAWRSPTTGRWSVIVMGLLIWEALARTVVDPKFVSPPSRVGWVLVTRIFADPVVRRAIGITFYELLLAFVLAVLVGSAVGVLIGAGAKIRRGVYPLVLMLYAVPQVTVLPLFVMFFGLGPASKVAFGFTHGVFPIAVNIVAGMRDLNPMHLLAARSMGAGRAQVLRHVTLPHLVPSFFAGLRLCVSMTLLGVILGELYASVDGVGFLAQLYAESFDPAPLFALVLTLAFMAILLNGLARRAELWFGRRWRQV